MNLKEDIWRKNWASITAVLRKEFPGFRFSGKTNFDGSVQIGIWKEKNCIDVYTASPSDLKEGETLVERFRSLMGKWK